VVAIVLGAGIQGVTAALALAQRGHAVTLVDEAEDCLLRASLVNEGKIHLGHVYANDPTFETPRLMLRAAWSFGPIVERLVGHRIDWASLTSTPFAYLVARDSQVGLEALVGHYARLDTAYQALRRERHGHYVGTEPAALWQPASIPPVFDPHAFAAAITTPELAVDPRRLRPILAAAVEAASSVATQYRHRVDRVERRRDDFVVHGRTPAGESWRREADLVVNCLWADRLRVDEGLAPPPARRWVYRL
jgi:glycine/D-amino acid oxidase-like deaminating enzyme